MATQAVFERVESSNTQARSLRLIWKDPETSRYHEVGWFTQKEAGSYRFQYSPQLPESFELLAQFPLPDKVYDSEDLPAFFANRVMSRGRASYSRYVEWLGLDTSALPVELLARTGGGRVTDTFHLVDSFAMDAVNNEGRFFVSGIQHTDNGLKLAEALHAGQQISMEDEPSNPHNPRAILLVVGGNKLGWVPDWLVDDIHRLRALGEVRIFVDQVNREAPARLRVLCRLVHSIRS